MLEVTLWCSLHGCLKQAYYQTKKDDIKMRKFMTKEVAVTKAMVGMVGLDENMLPVVTDVEHIEMLGELDKTKAGKKLAKMGITKTLFNVTTETRTYKMEVSEFIKVATLVTESDNVDEEDEDEDEDEKQPEPTIEVKKGRVTRVAKETV
jgi:hypothetical protein